MIQETILVVVIELVLAILVALITLLIVSRNKKKQRDVALENLIDEVKNHQPERIEKIATALMDNRKLDVDSAEDLAEILCDAEKQFLIKFIDYEMHSNLDDFYSSLCELLDSYLYEYPGTNAETRQAGGKIKTKVEEIQSTGNMKVLDPDQPPPDWGDVFD